MRAAPARHAGCTAGECVTTFRSHADPNEEDSRGRRARPGLRRRGGRHRVRRRPDRCARLAPRRLGRGPRPRRRRLDHRRPERPVQRHVGTARQPDQPAALGQPPGREPGGTRHGAARGAPDRLTPSAG
ncbi:hypothetical protein SBRY_10422 [Actinacidiphila bryophytorum]|uniref:Uncharacterized protein n=1 Tax=Actinacidiphila bryophytorum TaxID=1436133 RepID=A0A9W4E0E1_9ACTN|nr:hypothetical protein SBRY_10422 [Actinacidiphila bryophytorum]